MMFLQRVSLLIFGISLGGSVYAQELLSCGVVRSNVTLTTSCLGPMVVAANNITIDLGGHSVVSDVGDSIQMKNRSGVVIKNGGLGGMGGFRIEGGRDNSLRDLFIGASEGGGPLIINTQDGDLRRINFEVDTDASSIYIGGRGTKVSGSRFRIASDGRKEPLLRVGSGVIVSKNTFYGSSQGQPALVINSFAQVEDNTVEWEPTGLAPEGDLLSVLAVQGDDVILRSNSVRVTTQTASDAPKITAVQIEGSRNIVEANSITVSGAGLSSFGVSISPTSTKNMVRKNRIHRVEPAFGAGIFVRGSRCTILENRTDSILIVGSNNIAMRNVAPRTGEMRP